VERVEATKKSGALEPLGAERGLTGVKTKVGSSVFTTFNPLPLPILRPLLAVGEVVKVVVLGEPGMRPQLWTALKYQKSE
jgi:hypothetical protein